ncbi:hypothetical protein [Pseudescherichia sp.]|uniref:hypothetical protein n=1 Tax=Pseudescherichia sp. TaxID=2055881 RepID=UPI0028989627|nr:hypothetical protein [Pseudescherichia sp.]
MPTKLNTQISHEAEQARKVNLQTKHATIATHADSGWEQINMASVAPVRSEDGSEDGGGAMLVTTNVDASVFAESFAQSLDESLNDPEFIERLNESLSAEIRPYRSEPTPIQLALLADNSVRFNPTKRYADATDKPTTKVNFGQMVTVDKATDAVMFNHSVELYDFHMATAGFTELSLRRTVEQALVDICASMSSHCVDLLIDAKLTSKVEVTRPTGVPREQAEDIIDLLSVNLNAAYGATLSDYTLLIPSSLEAILERASQRAGVADVEDLLGCGVMEYNGEDRGLFLLPRRFTAMSFRSTADGDAFPVTLSRNVNKQAWVIEARGMIDLIASAVVEDADGIEVSLPLITQLAWK